MTTTRRTTETIDLLSSSSEDDQPPPPAAPGTTDNDSSSDDEIPAESVFTSKISASAAAGSKKRPRHNSDKEREKEMRKNQRLFERLEKQQKKAADKELKQICKLEAQQRMGRFAKDEIVVLVEPSLQHYSALSQLEYPQLVTDRIAKRTLQFIRRNHLQGGAKAALQAYQEDDASGYEWMDRVVLLFDKPRDFVELLERGDDDDDYPLLEEFLEAFLQEWSTVKPKILLLVPGVVPYILSEWSGQSGVSTSQHITDADLRDAIGWLHIAWSVETLVDVDVAPMLQKLTRALSEAAYHPPSTELECIRKLKNDSDPWSRMLQQIPGLSASRARALVQYYATPYALHQEFVRTQNPNLVAHLMDSERQNRKLSQFLYKLLTTQDGKELLN